MPLNYCCIVSGFCTDIIIGIPFCCADSSVVFILLGQYVTPVISGQPPPPCDGFTFNKVTNNSGILYGGDTPDGDSNIVYITKLMNNTVVSLYYI